jgi:hypothetical protein
MFSAQIVQQFCGKTEQSHFLFGCGKIGVPEMERTA